MRKQESIKNNYKLRSLLEKMCIDEAIKNRVYEFIQSTHSTEWGGKKGSALGAVDGYRDVTVLTSFDEAEHHLKSPVTLAIEVKHYALLQNEFSDFYVTLDIVSEIVGSYCSLDYPHNLWWAISSDIDSALLEIVAGKHAYFTKKWSVYKGGHYPCGHTSMDQLVVW